MQTDPLASAANAIASSLPVSTGLPPGGEKSGGAPFAGVLADAMTNLQGLEEQASSSVEGLLAGRGVDIHAAMIATQKSDMAFEMALAVRGKMVSAYQTMMGVQF